MQINKGIIFSNGEDNPVVLVGNQVTDLRRSVQFLNWAGILLVALAIGIGLGYFWPILREETKYAVGQTKIGKVMERINNTDLKVKIVIDQEPVERPNWLVPDENYSIYIPKILAKSRVLADVDPGDKNAYTKALKLGVAEAAGLAHPGEIGTTYLFAHSAGSGIDVIKYNAIFYLLDKLSNGDGIEVVYKEKLYKYIVEKKEIIGAAEIKYLKPQSQEERLVLQTCYPPGTAWKRLIVVAKPV